MAREFLQKGDEKGMIDATEQLHNFRSESLARLAQPSAKTEAATGTAVQAA
jgi:hypothetical protein